MASHQFNLLLSTILLLLGFLASSNNRAQGQNTNFDYGIEQVVMFQTDASGDTTHVSDLTAYLYDIGPAPHVRFEVIVRQIKGRSHLAANATLKVELYLLLQSKKASVYEGLSNTIPDLSPDSLAWVYRGPVDLSFERKRNAANRVTLLTDSHQFEFLDPARAITFASPLDFRLLGFAYRFVLVPAQVHLKDIDPRNNAFQLTFLKP